MADVLYGGSRFTEDRLALPGRTRMSTRTEIAAGLGFRGCDNGDPDLCSCGTWMPVYCARCGATIYDGDLVRVIDRATEYDGFPGETYWEQELRHVTCPSAGGDRG